jgi:hypothetical protein
MKPNRVREMMLVKPDYDIKDFLAAVGFLTPKGTDLEQFIVPSTQNFSLPENTGFVQVESNLDNVPGVTDTIEYERRDPGEMMDAGDWPTEYLDIQPELPGANGPAREYKPPTTPVGEQNSPFKDGGKTTYAFKQTDAADDLQNRISRRTESRTYGNKVEVELKEAVGPFPKRTLLVFKRKRHG